MHLTAGGYSWQALRENAPFGQYKVTGLKTSTGGVEEGPGHDISAEKIDPLEVRYSYIVKSTTGPVSTVNNVNLTSFLTFS